MASDLVRDPNEPVGVVAYWNDDAESWWFIPGDPADAAPSEDAFHGVVSAEAWEQWSVAQAEVTAAGDRLVAEMGLSPTEAELAEPCGAWTGTVAQAQPSTWSIAVPFVSTAGAVSVSYSGWFPDRSSAERVLASWPDQVHRLDGTLGRLATALRSDCTIGEHQHHVYEGPCQRCGHLRDEHPETGEQVAP